VLLGTVGALAGTTGVLASVTGLPLGISTACGCGTETADFVLEEGTKTAEFEKEATVETPLKLEAENEPTIECSKMQIEKGVVTNGSPEVAIKSVHFEGCADKSEASCEVPTIETGELQDTLEAQGVNGKGEKETDEKFKPKSGEVIAEFKLKNKGGEECKEREKTLKIEGDFISKKEDNDKSEKEHDLGIAVTPESKELKYGDQTVFAFFSINFHWRLTALIVWYLF
jgi:hypothetical protein